MFLVQLLLLASEVLHVESYYFIIQRLSQVRDLLSTNLVLLFDFPWTLCLGLKKCHLA